jgi:hypothetical protein
MATVAVKLKQDILGELTNAQRVFDEVAEYLAQHRDEHLKILKQVRARHPDDDELGKFYYKMLDKADTEKKEREERRKVDKDRKLKRIKQDILGELTKIEVHTTGALNAKDRLEELEVELKEMLKEEEEENV